MTEGDDQGCGLYWREDVQPNPGGNQSECKPCYPCDKRGGKRRRQINDNVGDRCVHRSLVLLCASRDSRRRRRRILLSTYRASICYASSARDSHIGKKSHRWDLCSEHLFKAVLKAQAGTPFCGAASFRLPKKVVR